MPSVVNIYYDLTKSYDFLILFLCLLCVRVKVTNAFLSLRSTSQFHGIPKDLATGQIAF